MELEEYMQKNSIDEYVLCEELDIKPDYLRNMIRGRVRPSVKLARRLEKITGGAVTFHDFIRAMTTYKSPKDRPCRHCGAIKKQEEARAQMPSIEPSSQ